MRSLRVALLVALVVVIVAPATPVAADDAVVTNNERRQALLHRDWPDVAAPGALLVTTVDAERARAVARAEHGRLLSERVVLVAPPHLPYPLAWIHAGVDLRQLSIIQAEGRDALWAAEQCLRSGSCGAVLSWLRQADDRSLRRLQVAAGSGQTLAFAYRPQAEAANPSPAALRLVLESQPAQVRVIKCRGGLPPARPLAFAWH